MPKTIKEEIKIEGTMETKGKEIGSIDIFRAVIRLQEEVKQIKENTRIIAKITITNKRITFLAILIIILELVNICFHLYY